MSKENGNTVTEITFKKNVDYFEMAEGTFYTVDALTKKYGLGRSTIYNKARDAGMEVTRIASFPCFMDDAKTFAKKERVYPPSHAKHLKPMTSYAELVKIVEATQKQVLAIDTRTFAHTGEIGGLNDKINLIYNSVYRMEATLNQILDHLTKEKNDA